MERQPHAFNPLFTHMISAGEAGGILDTILKRLSVYIEKQVKLQAQVRSAMIYPAAVMSIASIVVAGLLWKVIPTFASLFAGLNAQLPLATRAVIAASNLFISTLPFLVAGTVGGLFMLRRYYATPNGRLQLDGWLLRMPLLGPILRKVAVARFCRTLSTLISSGVPILTGLDVTARAAGNAVVEVAIKQARVRIERGESIATPLRATGVFPPMVAQMIGAGEATGALDVMLAKIAEFYEDEVDVAVAGLITVLEPMMMAILGVIGGIIGLVGGYLLASLISWVGIPMPPPPGATIYWTAKIKIVPSVLAFNFGLAVIASVVSSCYPALKASRLEIADALRHNI